MYRLLDIPVPPYNEYVIEPGLVTWAARNGLSMSPPVLVQVRPELVLLRRETAPGAIVVAYEREIPTSGIDAFLKKEIQACIDPAFGPYPERASVKTDKASVELTFHHTILSDWHASSDELVYGAVRAYYPPDAAEALSYILQKLRVPHISVAALNKGVGQLEGAFARKHHLGMDETFDMFFSYVLAQSGFPTLPAPPPSPVHRRHNL